MKPKKRRAASPPDVIKEEPAETLGGTNGEDEDWGRTVENVESLEGDEGGGGGYGRPVELGDGDERPI